MNDQTMLNVDFTGVEESTGTKYPERVSPGVYDFKIMGWELGAETNEKKTPFAMITFNVGEAQHIDKFHLTPGALPRLKHMLLACGVNKDLLETNVTVEQLKKASIGKSFHGLLGGEEYLNKEQQLRTKARFSFYGFAEPIGSNTLVFKESKDITRLKQNPHNQPMGMSASNDLAMAQPKPDDLPF